MQKQSGMQFLATAMIRSARALADSALRALYPPHCLTCDTLIEEQGALCPGCWRQTPFIFGLCCDLCGLPLPGQDGPGAAAIICDECMTIARPWEQGRAAMLYDDRARQILLGLKYRDRLDMVPLAAKWLARTAQPLLLPDMLVAPIPLHWLRLLKRRYNQAALLSHALARETGLAHCPDLLTRIRYTGSQDGRGRDERFANLQGAIRPHPRRAHLLCNRHILLVDDVMTVGATFAAATEACLAHGAASVRVIALARVASRG